MLVYEKPTHVLKELYDYLSKEVSWQAFFSKEEIANRDLFVRKYATGLYEFAHQGEFTGYPIDTSYEYILSQIDEKQRTKLAPTLEEFRKCSDFYPVFVNVCRDYYNNPKEEDVITLLRHLDEKLSFFSFAGKYIPKMYENVINPQTTRFLYPLYVSRVILDDVIFANLDDDYPGQAKFRKALPLLFVESFGTQVSHSIADGYKEYINLMYKKTPVRWYVDRLARNIFHSPQLTVKEKKQLLKKIDSSDEFRYKLHGEEMPNQTYVEKYFPKKNNTYVKVVYTPMGGQNKRY